MFFPDETYVCCSGIRWPVFLEVLQKLLPVSRDAVLLEIRNREREPMVDADDGRSVAAKFFTEPLSKAASCPVFSGTRRRLNLLRRFGVFSDVNSETFATRIWSLRTGIVDAYVTAKLGQVEPHRGSQNWHSYPISSNTNTNREIVRNISDGQTRTVIFKLRLRFASAAPLYMCTSPSSQ
jgi:hypothetical protein